MSRRRALLVAGLPAGWLAFVVAHRVLSGRWWLWLFPDLLPPPVFVVVPLGLLAFVLAARPPLRRWIAGMALAGLALGGDLSGLNPYVLAPRSTAVPAGAPRVVSFNTDQWNHTDDPDRLYRFLRAQDSDIYLLQEYKPYEDAARQASDFGLLHRYFPGYQIATVGDLLTLSRLPITAARALPAKAGLEPNPGPSPVAFWCVENWNVKTLRTDIRVGSRTMSVYNVHMPVPLHMTNPFSSSFYERRRWYAQRRAVQFRGIEADVTANQLPVLVAGDFNTTPAMGELRGLTGRLREAASAGRSLYPVSWAGAGLPHLWYLDRALVSPSVRVHQYRLVEPRGLSEHRAQRLAVSLEDDGGGTAFDTRTVRIWTGATPRATPQTPVEPAAHRRPAARSDLLCVDSDLG